MDIHEGAPAPAHECARLISEIRNRQEGLFTQADIVDAIGIAEEVQGGNQARGIRYLAREISNAVYDLTPTIGALEALLAEHVPGFAAVLVEGVRA